jgi:hypothetical protein
MREAIDNERTPFADDATIKHTKKKNIPTLEHFQKVRRLPSTARAVMTTTKTT